MHVHVAFDWAYVYVIPLHESEALRPCPHMDVCMATFFKVVYSEIRGVYRYQSEDTDN